MTLEQAAQPHIAQTWTVEVKCVVKAIVTTQVTVTDEEVAEWLGVPPAEVESSDAEAYAQEEAADESAFELEDIESWDKTTTTVIRRSRVQITPPEFVPLFPDVHAHSTRELRDRCVAGWCHVDDRIEPGT